MSVKSKNYTTNQILGLNQSIGFLLEKPIEDVSVSVSWDLVLNQNKIGPIVKSISELGTRINRQFYAENDKGEFKIIPGKQEESDLAEKELNEKTFELELVQINFEKIKGIPGITGINMLQLHPIITKS